MKLMLVGRAAQGKTTLMHRLMRDYSYNINKSTNGMEIFKYWVVGKQIEKQIVVELILKCLIFITK